MIQHLRSTRLIRGQAILEYVMMLVVVALPIAAAIRGVVEDKKETKKKNLIYTAVKDAYGDETRMGVIGRPYP